MINNFKVGDRVILTSHELVECEENPIWGEEWNGEVVGTIVSFDDFEYPINVDWDNGEMNAYKDYHLSFVSLNHRLSQTKISLPDELFTMDEL